MGTAESRSKATACTWLGAVGHALKWPLAEPEVTKSLARLNRLKTAVLLALTTDQTHTEDTDRTTHRRGSDRTINKGL